MTISNVDLSSYGDFAAYLTALEREAGSRRAMRPVANAISDILRPIRSAIRESTPVRTGTLRRLTRIRAFRPRPDRFERFGLYTNAYVGWMPRSGGPSRSYAVMRFIEDRDGLGAGPIATAWDARVRNIERDIATALERRIAAMARDVGRRFPTLEVR